METLFYDYRETKNRIVENILAIYLLLPWKDLQDSLIIHVVGVERTEAH